MKNFIMIISIMALSTGCSSVYKIKGESGNVVNTTPGWFMADINDTKACNLKLLSKKDDNKKCVYGVGTAVSPSLDLAIEKAKMKAKAEIADNIMGEMNKESKQYAKEVGSSVATKQVVNDFESVVVNKIDSTVVRGYETFAQDVTLTKNGNYRAWVGLRLPLGEFNKLYEYNAEESLNAFNLNERSKEAYSNLMKKEEDENRDIQ